MKKEEVFEDLRMRITSGEVSPGKWLVERELGDTYKVSRTPIRETLRKLSNLGIVVLQPAKGYQVKILRVEEIVEIFHAREAVEGECARLACLTSSGEFAEKIDDLRKQLEAVEITKDSAKGVVIGNKIHNLIMEMADNRFLSEFYQKLSNLMALTRNMSKHSAIIEERSKIDHLRILRALRDGNADAGEKLMREHLRGTCKALVKNYLNPRGRLDGAEDNPW
jgi:DNA-binding GntR family transcriptional regulator